MRKRRRRRLARRKRRLPVLIVISLIVLVLVIAVGEEVLRRVMPNKEMANLEELYGAEEGYASIIANHQWVKGGAIWEEDHAYLEYPVIRDELNGHFYWDPVEKLLLYTLPEEIVRADASTQFDGASVFLEKEDQLYVSLSYVEKYSNIRVEYFENPARIVLQTEWGTALCADLKKQAALRVEDSRRSEVIANLEAGSTVTVLQQDENWTKAQTEDGWVGYLSNRDLGESYTVEEKGPYEEPVYANVPVDYDVCLLWHQMTAGGGTDALQSLLAAKTPVTTIAPTWFSMNSNDGSFGTLANREYVDLAHQAGLDVWPTVENVNHTELDMTALLQSTTNRSRLVQGIMVELEECGADGLNVDIENLPESAGDGYVQLIRELSLECHKRGLVLSVDDYVPSAWTQHYNRREQGVMADYVIIMAYDEHYSGSDPGSTASLPFVKDGIEDTLEEVPAEKVINGIPFYTRLWTETNTELTSNAISMDEAAAFVKEQGATPEWMEDLGQNYVRVSKEDGTVYQIWLEDAESMEARLVMMSPYHLAGMAFWKLGMQNDSIWEVIARYSGQ